MTTITTSTRDRAVPLHLALGALLIAVAWPLAWSGLEPWSHYTFFPLWLGYILAVDGVSTRGVENFYRLLENKANRVVTLLVNSRPDRTGAREERVRPISKETNVRYLDWVQSRREMVDRPGRIAGRTGRSGCDTLFV